MVHDLSRVIMHFLYSSDAALLGTYNTGGPERLSRADMAHAIAVHCGMDPAKVDVAESAAVKRAGAFLFPERSSVAVSYYIEPSVMPECCQKTRMLSFPVRTTALDALPVCVDSMGTMTDLQPDSFSHPSIWSYQSSHCHVCNLHSVQLHQMVASHDTGPYSASAKETMGVVTTPEYSSQCTDVWCACSPKPSGHFHGLVEAAECTPIPAAEVFNCLEGCVPWAVGSKLNCLLG